MKQTSLFLDFLFKMLNSALLLLILQVLTSQGTVTWTGHMLQSTLSCSHVARYVELFTCCKLKCTVNWSHVERHCKLLTCCKALWTAHMLQGTLNCSNVAKYTLLLTGCKVWWISHMLQGTVYCELLTGFKAQWTTWQSTHKYLGELLSCCKVWWIAHRLQGMMNCSQFAKRSKQHRKVSGTIQMSHIEMN